MDIHFAKTKKFLQDLNYKIVKEKVSEGIFVIEKESYGIKNLVIGVAYPILIIEQLIFKVAQPTETMFHELLKKNRDIIHGAFVLDETGQRVIFRDTLQLENLDKNEIEASLNSVSILLSEYNEEIIKFSKY